MLLGARLFGLRAALVAGWCLSLAQIHIYYTQEIRPYSMVTFLALVSLYSFVRAIEGSGRWWLLHAAANALMVFTHLFAVPLLFAEFLFLAVARFRTRRIAAWWVGGHAALGVVLAAWILFVDGDSVHREVTLYHRPTLHDIANVYLTYAGGRVSQLSPKEFLPGGINLDPLLGLLYVGAAAWLGWHTWRGKPVPPQKIGPGGTTMREKYLFLLLCLCAPVALVVLMSYAWKPALNARYFAYCALAFYVLVGGCAAAIRRKSAFAVFIVALLSLSGYQTLAMLRTPFRPDYEYAANVIARDAAPADRVLVLKGLNLISMRLCWPGDSSRVEIVGSEQDLFEKSDEAIAQGRSAWVVFWRWNRLEHWEAHLSEHETLFTRDIFGGMPPLYLYRVSSK